MIRKFLLATLVIASMITSAMAIDFDAKIVNLDGSQPTDEKGQPVNLTVGTVCVNALMSPTKEDASLSGEEKIRRTTLAQHIQKRDDYKYTAEDVATIKKLVNSAYPSPLIVSQTWEVLERK